MQCMNLHLIVFLSIIHYRVCIMRMLIVIRTQNTATDLHRTRRSHKEQPNESYYYQFFVVFLIHSHLTLHLIIIGYLQTKSIP